MCTVFVLNVHLSQLVFGNATVDGRNKILEHDVTVRMPQDLLVGSDGSLFLMRRFRVPHRAADAVQDQQNRDQIDSRHLSSRSWRTGSRRKSLMKSTSRFVHDLRFPGALFHRRGIVAHWRRLVQVTANVFSKRINMDSTLFLFPSRRWFTRDKHLWLSRHISSVASLFVIVVVVMRGPQESLPAGSTRLRTSMNGSGRGNERCSEQPRTNQSAVDSSTTNRPDGADTTSGTLQLSGKSAVREKWAPTGEAAIYTHAVNTVIQIVSTDICVKFAERYADGTVADKEAPGCSCRAREREW